MAIFASSRFVLITLMYKNLHSNLCYFHLQRTIAHLYTWRSWNHPSLQRLKHWRTPSWNKPEKKNRNKDQNLLTAQHKQQTIQQLSYLISPSFLAVADPTFFAAVAVLDPASLNIVFVAAAPVLSLLYLKTQMDQNHWGLDTPNLYMGSWQKFTYYNYWY